MKFARSWNAVLDSILVDSFPYSFKFGMGHFWCYGSYLAYAIEILVFAISFFFSSSFFYKDTNLQENKDIIKIKNRLKHIKTLHVWRWTNPTAIHCTHTQIVAKGNCMKREYIFVTTQVAYQISLTLLEKILLT